MKNYLLYHEALNLCQNRKYKEAEDILLRIIKKDKRDKDLLFLLGRVKSKLGDDKKAIKCFRECVKVNPQTIYPRLELKRIYCRMGEFEKAEKEVIKSIKIMKTINKPDSFLHYELGKVYLCQGRVEEAEKEILECISTDNKIKWDSRQVLGKIYMAQGREEEAEEQLINSIAIGKENAVHSMLMLGTLYAKQKRFEEAKAQLQRCMKYTKNNHKYASIILENIQNMEEKGENIEEGYDDIIENVCQNCYADDTMMSHIEKHTKNDLEKMKHGVFTLPLTEIIGKLDIDKCKKKPGNVADIYCFKVEGCGYEGGIKGSGKQLDYVTVITEPNDRSKIITMFPSKELKIKVKQKEEIER